MNIVSPSSSLNMAARCSARRSLLPLRRGSYRQGERAPGAGYGASSGYAAPHRSHSPDAFAPRFRMA